MADPRVVTSDASFILYDDAGLDPIAKSWFQEIYWRERDLVVAEVPGRGSVLFIRHANDVWVLRHYRRGGFVARVTEDNYLWTGLERTRAFREWRLLRTLHNDGMPVPRPIAAHVTRAGLSYRADIITACIENTRSLASMIASGDGQASQWASIGTTLRRFHDKGVDHADLNAHNILIDAEQRVFLVDFDRGGLKGDGAWKRGNLKRLLRSLRKISLETGAAFDEEAWRLLLRSYRSER